MRLAIVECTLSSAPDFEDRAALTDILCRGAEGFVAAVSDLSDGG
jgi:hypothetical protein